MPINSMETANNALVAYAQNNRNNNTVHNTNTTNSNSAASFNTNQEIYEKENQILHEAEKPSNENENISSSIPSRIITGVFSPFIAIGNLFDKLHQ